MEGLNLTVFSETRAAILPHDLEQGQTKKTGKKCFHTPPRGQKPQNRHFWSGGLDLVFQTQVKVTFFFLVGVSTNYVTPLDINPAAQFHFLWPGSPIFDADGGLRCRNLTQAPGCTQRNPTVYPLLTLFLSFFPLRLMGLSMKSLGLPSRLDCLPLSGSNSKKKTLS